MKPELKDYVALVGLDWADQKHDVALRPQGSATPEPSSFKQEPQAIADWVGALRERFGPGKIAIALEQSRGALIYALMGHENLVLYPINPKTLAKLRAAALSQRQERRSGRCRPVAGAAGGKSFRPAGHRFFAALAHAGGRAAGQTGGPARLLLRP